MPFTSNGIGEGLVALRSLATIDANITRPTGQAGTRHKLWRDTVRARKVRYDAWENFILVRWGCGVDFTQHHGGDLIKTHYLQLPL